MKLIKLFEILIVVLLIITVILMPLLSLFTSNLFYNYGYEQNKVYKKIDQKVVWEITDEFQGFIQNKNKLTYFEGEEKIHLEEVKQIYNLGMSILKISVLLLVLLMSFSGLNIKQYSKILKQTSKNLFWITIILLLLGVNWNWFFTKFHEILFQSKWIFSTDTLMIQLWGGNFFVLAAIIIFLEYLLLTGFIYGLARLIMGFCKNNY